MADMEEAVATVKSFASQFLGNVTELGLEEFERDGGLWKMTFGYRPGWVQAREGQSPLADLQVPRREYRVFWVNDEGRVIAMRRPERWSEGTSVPNVFPRTTSISSPSFSIETHGG